MFIPLTQALTEKKVITGIKSLGELKDFKRGNQPMEYNSPI